MAIDDFWWSIKAASHSSIGRVLTPATHGDVSRIEKRLRNAVPWLTPAAVTGFDANDFSFLPSDEQAELKTQVEAFRRVAETVPDNGPATDRQIEDGEAAFHRILEILQQDEYPDAEAFRASKILEGLRFPEVEKILMEFDSDSTGDPAIRIWVILRDNVARRPNYFQDAVRIRDKIDLTLRLQGIKRWPYINFRTASEQRALERAARR